MIDLDVDNIIKLYKSGVSELALSKQFGVNRGTIRRRLLNAGIIPRGESEAQRAWNASRTIAQRKAQTISARNARRGQKDTYETLVKRAKTIERMGKLDGTYEVEIAAELRRRGIPFVPLKALGKYNIDFFIFNRIALEVYGGEWHRGGRHIERFAERSEYIRNRGFHLVLCWVSRKYGGFDSVAICDRLETLFDVLCSYPAVVGKQYMIRGDGKDTTIGRSDFHNIT